MIIGVYNTMLLLIFIRNFQIKCEIIVRFEIRLPETRGKKYIFRRRVFMVGKIERFAIPQARSKYIFAQHVSHERFLKLNLKESVDLHLHKHGRTWCLTGNDDLQEINHQKFIGHRSSSSRNQERALRARVYENYVHKHARVNVHL